jgi:hypothetical protein
MSQSGRPLLRNVYKKNAFCSGNEVITCSVSAETNILNTAASEIVKLKDSTRCLLDRSADGCNRQIQTNADRDKIKSRAKKTPDRRGPKQIPELGSQIPTDCGQLK